MMLARHDIAKLVGIPIAVVALGLTTPGTAAADATDEVAFIRKLFADEINFAAKDKVIQRALGGLLGVWRGHVAGERSREPSVRLRISSAPGRGFHGRRGPGLLPLYADQFIEPV
jgi:hypothetical protein